MDRPTGLTDQSNNTDVSSVTYNAANQLLGLNYLGTAETRTYNNLNQMTNLTVGSAMNITYTFPAGANNGKISRQANSVSGETVTYQYDSLNRLLSASSSQSWSETYAYDGFGNLLSKTPTGGAPTLSQSVSATTNQIVGVTYDANGNQVSGGYGYDAENRMATATGIQYGYDSRNKRVWSGATSGSSVTQTVYFYGVDGRRLGIYSFVTPPSELGAPQLSDLPKSLAVYFGGKRVGTVVNGATASFTQDRLGSNGSYYPYGEARGTVPQDDVGYATYTNDSATGLQYADQRYYASNFGRFMSPDPYRASAGPRDPRSWNRYTYTRGDPINRVDRVGLQDDAPSKEEESDCNPDNDDCTPTFTVTHTEDGGGGGGGDESCDDNPYQAACAGDDGGNMQAAGGAPVRYNGRGVLTKGNGILSYVNLIKSGKAVDNFENQLQLLVVNIDPGCLSWLTTNLPSGESFETYVTGLLIGDYDSVIDNQTNTYAPADAVAGDAGLDILFAATDASLGLKGVFAVSIHEIAHLLKAPGFQNNDGALDSSGNLTPAAQQAQTNNANLIDSKCGKTIN